MTDEQVEVCRKFRKEFEYQLFALGPTRKEVETFFIHDKSKPQYKIEDYFVYNMDFNLLSANKEISLILVGDNPGIVEQRESRYLVGQAGKFAEKFFAEHKELGVNFSKGVIILNKTPIHTRRTQQLAKLLKNASYYLQKRYNESLIFMANWTFTFHKTFPNASVWIMGYSEMKQGGIFQLYRDAIAKNYSTRPDLWDKVFVYRHFSRNLFTSEINKACQELEATTPNVADTSVPPDAVPPTFDIRPILQKIGKAHKDAIFDGLMHF